MCSQPPLRARGCGSGSAGPDVARSRIARPGDTPTPAHVPAPTPAVAPAPTPTHALAPAIATLLAGVVAVGCSDTVERDPSPIAATVAASPSLGGGDPPAEIADAIRSVAHAGEELGLWPFTGWNFGGDPVDPINLIFRGEADPANIRSALLALDADRGAFGLPPVPPFDCTWRDAAGGMQATWAEGQWSGNVIQLECGTYEVLRMHLRLFPAGEWTVANAHFEVLIPGTTDHQVLSWNLARDFVALDIGRTGLLGAPLGVAPGLTPAPEFRAIHPLVYNGLPGELRDLIGGPPDDVSGPVGIKNDGNALIAYLAERAEPQPGTVRHDFVVHFNRTVPKPICVSSPADGLHAVGPIRFIQTVTTDPRGEVRSTVQVVGELEVTSVNLATGEVTADTRRAQVTDHYHASTLGAGGGRISSSQLRLLTAQGGHGPAESRRTRLSVGPFGLTDWSMKENCSG